MKFIKGDITETDLEWIAHGCNAQGVMGSGVARALRKKWPEIFEPYVQLLKDVLPENHLGAIVIVRTGRKAIANMITQQHYGNDGKRYANPLAIREALGRLIRVASPNHQTVRIATVKIGCGLGGLDWDTDVKPVFEELERVYNVDFTIYEN